MLLCCLNRSIHIGLPCTSNTLVGSQTSVGKRENFLEHFLYALSIVATATSATTARETFCTLCSSIICFFANLRKIQSSFNLAIPFSTSVQCVAFASVHMAAGKILFNMMFGCRKTRSIFHVHNMVVHFELYLKLHSCSRFVFFRVFHSFTKVKQKTLNFTLWRRRQPHKNICTLAFCIVHFTAFALHIEQ